MRLKDLFTVPTGQKVTEKHLHRVLISSICSILLCMSCLVSTTWAWFVVGIENTGNVIEIGTPQVNLTVNGTPFMSGTTLQPQTLQSETNTVQSETNTVQSKSNTLKYETYKVSIEHANGGDDFQKKSTLYVTLTIGENTIVYITLSHENGYKKEFTIMVKEGCSLSWDVSWFAPANATELIDDTIILNPITNNTVTGGDAGTNESTENEQTKDSKTASNTTSAGDAA